MSLSAIPLPLRIVGGLLIGMLLFRFLGGMGPLLLIIGIVLWIVVLAALLYDSGPLASLGGMPGVGRGLDWITNRQSAQMTTSVAPAPDQPGAAAEPSQPRGGLGDSDRETLMAEAYAALDALIGQQTAVDLIETRLFEPVRAAAGADGQVFGSRAPAMLVLVSGPRGVGVPETAFAIARGFAGLGALKRAHIAELRTRDTRNDAAEAATKKAEEAIGGTLLLRDADWLLAPDAYGAATPPGVEAGMAILEVAERKPQSFMIVATLPEGMDEKLRMDAGHRRWLDRLAVRPVKLNALNDDELLEILQRELTAIGCPLEDEGIRPARALIREVREAQGEDFDNAEACRRLAEQLSTAETEIGLEEGIDPAPGGEARPIARRHVMRVQETWE
ncbi:MAG: hypothetical protein AAF577_11685 [Pseudomonadota bacterium]